MLRMKFEVLEFDEEGKNNEVRKRTMYNMEYEILS